MGTIGAAPPTLGRRRSSAAGWIVAGVLAFALGSFAVFELTRRPTNRETVAAAAAPDPARKSSPAAIPTPAIVSSDPRALTPFTAAESESPSAPARALEAGVASSPPQPTASSAPTAAAPAWGCPEQAAALLEKLDPLISQFEREKDLALETARISLAPGISKLDEILRKTESLEVWPEPVCGYRIKEKVLHAEGFDVERLKSFMGGSNTADSAEAREAWEAVERELKELRAVIQATGGALRR